MLNEDLLTAYHRYKSMMIVSTCYNGEKNEEKRNRAREKSEMTTLISWHGHKSTSYSQMKLTAHLGLLVCALSAAMG